MKCIQFNFITCIRVGPSGVIPIAVLKQESNVL